MGDVPIVTTGCNSPMVNSIFREIFQLLVHASSGNSAPSVLSSSSFQSRSQQMFESSRTNLTLNQCVLSFLSFVEQLS